MTKFREAVSDIRLIWALMPLFGVLTALPLLALPFLSKRRTQADPNLGWIIPASLVFFGYMVLRGIFALPAPDLHGALSTILPISLLAGYFHFFDFRREEPLSSGVFAYVAMVVCAASFVLFLLDPLHQVAMLSGNALLLAATLVPSVYVNAYYAFRTRGRLMIFHYCGVLSSLVGLGLFVGSRMPFMAACVCLCITICFALAARRKKFSRKVVFSTVVGFFVVVSTIFAISGGASSEKFRKMFAGDMSTETVTEIAGPRAAIWKGSIEVIKESVVFGHGPQKKGMIIQPYLTERWQEEKFTHSHNAYLTWGVAGGVVAIALGIGLLLSVIIPNFLRSGFSAPHIELILNGCVAVALMGLTNIILFESFAATTTFLMLVVPVFMFPQIRSD